MQMRKLWLWLGVVFVLSFAALGWLGREIYLAAPPIPELVRTSAGETLYSAEQIEDGQRAWRSAGGQQLGSVLGHGAYVAAVREEMRSNTYDPQSRQLTLSPERAAAIAQVERHYVDLFGNAPALDTLREQYAMTADALQGKEEAA